MARWSSLASFGTAPKSVKRSAFAGMVGNGGSASLHAAALAIAGGVWCGWWLGLLLVVAIPVIGLTGLLVRERWYGAWADVRRWVLLRSRRRLMDSLRSTQRELGLRLDRLFDDHAPRGTG